MASNTRLTFSIDYDPVQVALSPQDVTNVQNTVTAELREKGVTSGQVFVYQETEQGDEIEAPEVVVGIHVQLPDQAFRLEHLAVVQRVVLGILQDYGIPAHPEDTYLSPVKRTRLRQA
jgi:hypothetical protein